MQYVTLPFFYWFEQKASRSQSYPQGYSFSSRRIAKTLQYFPENAGRVTPLPITAEKRIERQENHPFRAPRPGSFTEEVKSALALHRKYMIFTGS